MYVWDGCGHCGVDDMCIIGRVSQTKTCSICTLTIERLYQTNRLNGEITQLPTFFRQVFYTQTN